jgi:uncharacterized protein (TIGR02594 family)
VSTIAATDGARPLADAEIVLRVSGKDTALKSNAAGQFPPIPHPRESVQVLQRTQDGKLKEIGNIGGDKGKSYSLLTQLQRFIGISGPDKPPPDATKQRQPFAYQVQPGDTMAGIAKRFRTTVDEIKQNNRRFNDKLFAGELLGIYGPLPQGDKPVKAPPRKAPARPPQKVTAESPPLPPSTSATPTLPARADEGEGKPLALLPPDQRRAPWMVYAIAEAKRLKGMQESEIEASGTNYHTAIKDGLSTMVGNNNAWCAAFVNWCLSQAGYPIDKKSIWSARARGIRSHDLRNEKGELIQNPLFTQIDNPIFGCIAMQSSIARGLGHHVGFIYAQESSNHLIILGGNQSDRIMFEKYTTTSKTDRLEYFVPTSYTRQAADDSHHALDIMKADELNAAFNISTIKTKPGSNR